MQFMKLEDVAKAIDGRVVGNGAIEVTRPVDPGFAGAPGDLAVAIERPAVRALKDTKAKAAVVADGAQVPDGLLDGYIVASRPRTALAELTVLFEQPLARAKGIHPQAAVDASARLGKDVSIGAFAAIGKDTHVGDGTVIAENVTLSEGARVGERCTIHPGVRIAHRAEIGDDVIIHSNAVIGADGFSYATPTQSSFEAAKLIGRVESTNEEIVRVSSLGRIIIGNEVEIGASTTIDRGTLKDTVIGDGTKIDNQVQIAHNVTIGRNCMICAQVGIAGSAEIGDRVVLAGKVGVADHVHVGDDSVIGAGSGLYTNVPAKSIMYGYPAMPMAEAARHFKHIRTLHELFADVEELKKAAADRTAE
ncbi:MAG: UDP-3-O-(3-hydroxymyristoyl)glucosamine N-acyltransferase [Alphaproteobacteria bacterium]|nr:UDP-3-O-(3-hydroxymyristoyl)glucosamine N-acyltransferase [Alphaproteobacteria bacterium]